jgi:hypothetical protein
MKLATDKILKYKIDIDSVLDFCATKSYELPLINAGFVFELKNIFLFLNNIQINLAKLKNYCIVAVQIAG